MADEGEPTGDDLSAGPPDFFAFHDAETAKIAGDDNENPTRATRPSPLSDPRIKRYLAATVALFTVAVVGTIVVILSGHSDTVTAQSDAAAAQSTAAVAASQASQGQAFASQVNEVCTTRGTEVVVTGVSQAIISGSEICQTASSLATASIAVVPGTTDGAQPPDPVTVTLTRTEPREVSTVTLTVPGPMSTVSQTVVVTLPAGDPGVLTVTLVPDPVTLLPDPVVVTQTQVFVGPTVVESTTIDQTETATVTETQSATETQTQTQTVPADPVTVLTTVTTTETATTTATTTETTTVTVPVPPGP